MSSMRIEGTIHALFDTQTVGRNNFQKREFVIAYADNPQYPQYIKFEAIKDNCSKLDGFSKGDAVEVEFNLRGRAWESPQGDIKYFTSLEAWKIQKAGQGGGQGPRGAQPMPNEQPPLPAADVSKGGDDPFGEDDMPF